MRYPFTVKQTVDPNGKIFFDVPLKQFIHADALTMYPAMRGNPVAYSCTFTSCDEKIVSSETLPILRDENVWGDIVNGRESYRSSFVDSLYINKDGAFVIETTTNDTSIHPGFFPRVP